MHTLIYALLASVASAVVFGLAPAMRGAQTDLNSVLKSESSGAENIVLDGAGQLLLAHALLFSGDDITGQHG